MVQEASVNHGAEEQIPLTALFDARQHLSFRDYMKGPVPAAKRNMSNGIKLSAILQSIRRNSNWPGFTRLKHEEGYLCRKAVTSVSNATNLTRPDTRPICSRWRMDRDCDADGEGYNRAGRECNMTGQGLLCSV